MSSRTRTWRLEDKLYAVYSSTLSSVNEWDSQLTTYDLRLDRINSPVILGTGVSEMLLPLLVASLNSAENAGYTVLFLRCSYRQIELIRKEKECGHNKLKCFRRFRRPHVFSDSNVRTANEQNISSSAYASSRMRLTPASRTNPFNQLGRTTTSCDLRHVRNCTPAPFVRSEGSC